VDRLSYDAEQIMSLKACSTAEIVSHPLWFQGVSKWLKKLMFNSSPKYFLRPGRSFYLDSYIIFSVREAAGNTRLHACGLFTA
jgi:signal-transduction protein with cAMP-binding, CBS, and nucleotidyltransferase domain